MRGKLTGKVSGTERRVTISEIKDIRRLHRTKGSTVRALSLIYDVPEEWVSLALKKDGLEIWRKRLAVTRCLDCRGKLSNSVKAHYCPVCIRIRELKSLKEARRVKRLEGIGSMKVADLVGVQKGALYFAKALFRIANGRTYANPELRGEGVNQYEAFDELEAVFRRFLFYIGAQGNRLNLHVEVEAEWIKLMQEIHKAGGETDEQ